MFQTRAVRKIHDGASAHTLPVACLAKQRLAMTEATLIHPPPPLSSRIALALFQRSGSQTKMGMSRVVRLR